MLLLEDKRQDILKKEWDDIIRQREYERIMGIKEFDNKRILWMKKVLKYYMRNNKDQGYTQINWAGIGLAKRRR